MGLAYGAGQGWLRIEFTSVGAEGDKEPRMRRLRRRKPPEPRVRAR